MRTTLALDDDVIAYARSHARRERVSLGEVVSCLARRGIVAEGRIHRTLAEPKSHYALRAARDETITVEHVRDLMDPKGIWVVANKLAEICAALDNAFWLDDVSLRTPGRVNWSRVLGVDLQPAGTIILRQHHRLGRALPPIERQGRAHVDLGATAVVEGQWLSLSER